ncbi:MAG: Uma2 family endonuclease [Acidobacteriota bacterium]|nr:Uma2 family endonuclease [Acidobacteriota bacterium]
MTVEEFLALPEKEGVRMELSDGVLIEEEITLSNADPRHELVKSNLIEVLVPFAQHVKVFVESIYKLRDSARSPDVSLVSRARLVSGDAENYRQQAPDFAIEVVSSETAAESETKIWQYGSARVFREHQFLESSEILPDFRVQVSRIFEGL